ncbi:MAG: hypothetical protein HYY16_15805 [Planctomycetes bacterium]|nr:hypothetical protein [Planctomycetota bacterium]
MGLGLVAGALLACLAIAGQNGSPADTLDRGLLEKAYRHTLSRIPELDAAFRSAEAEGVELFLYGGVARNVGFFSKQQLLRKGQAFFLETAPIALEDVVGPYSDLDLIVGGSSDAATRLESALKQQFPEGERFHKWDVRTVEYLQQPWQVTQGYEPISKILVGKDGFVEFDWRWTAFGESLTERGVAEILSGTITYVRNPRYGQSQPYQSQEHHEFLEALRYLRFLHEFEGVRPDEASLESARAILKEAAASGEVQRFLSNPLFKTRVEVALRKLQYTSLDNVRLMKDLTEIGLLDVARGMGLEKQIRVPLTEGSMPAGDGRKLGQALTVFHGTKGYPEAWSIGRGGPFVTTYVDPWALFTSTDVQVARGYSHEGASDYILKITLSPDARIGEDLLIDGNVIRILTRRAIEHIERPLTSIELKGRILGALSRNDPESARLVSESVRELGWRLEQGSIPALRVMKQVFRSEVVQAYPQLLSDFRSYVARVRNADWGNDFWSRQRKEERRNILELAAVAPPESAGSEFDGLREEMDGLRRKLFDSILNDLRGLRPEDAVKAYDLRDGLVWLGSVLPTYSRKAEILQSIGDILRETQADPVRQLQILYLLEAASQDDAVKREVFGATDAFLQQGAVEAVFQTKVPSDFDNPNLQRLVTLLQKVGRLSEVYATLPRGQRLLLIKAGVRVDADRAFFEEVARTDPDGDLRLEAWRMLLGLYKADPTRGIPETLRFENHLAVQRGLLEILVHLKPMIPGGADVIEGWAFRTRDPETFLKWANNRYVDQEVRQAILNGLGRRPAGDVPAIAGEKILAEDVRQTPAWSESPASPDSRFASAAVWGALESLESGSAAEAQGAVAGMRDRMEAWRRAGGLPEGPDGYVSSLLALTRFAAHPIAAASKDFRAAFDGIRGMLAERAVRGLFSYPTGSVDFEDAMGFLKSQDADSIYRSYSALPSDRRRRLLWSDVPPAFLRDVVDADPSPENRTHGWLALSKRSSDIFLRAARQSLLLERNARVQWFAMANLLRMSPSPESLALTSQVAKEAGHPGIVGVLLAFARGQSGFDQASRDTRLAIEEGLRARQDGDQLLRQPGPSPNTPQAPEEEDARETPRWVREQQGGVQGTRTDAVVGVLFPEEASSSGSLWLRWAGKVLRTILRPRAIDTLDELRRMEARGARMRRVK